LFTTKAGAKFCGTSLTETAETVPLKVVLGVKDRLAVVLVGITTVSVKLLAVVPSKV
jgi:hypothetical protein